MTPGGPSKNQKGPCVSRQSTTPRLVVLRFAGVCLSLLLSACAERDLLESPSAPDATREHSGQAVPGEGMNLPKIMEGSGADHDSPPYPAYPPIVHGKIVVKVWAEDDLEYINETYGTTTESYYYNCDYAVLIVPNGTNEWELCQEIYESGICPSAQPIYVTESPESNQGTIPFYEGGHVISDVFDQSALDRIGVVQAHQRATGAGVVVAVLDTGVDFTHPDLAAFLSQDGYDFLDHDSNPQDEADGINQDGDSMTDEGAGHGTHVAGLVHAVAPDATILPIRVLNSEGNGTSVAVALGILDAIEKGARVINLSLGLDIAADIIKDAIKDALDEEVVVVASAGNRGIQDDNHFPANRNEVLSVAATNNVDLKADFSSYSSHVDMCTPGENILSTFLNQGYAIWSGTSMSTPMVSGAAALRIQLHPSASAVQIKAGIENSALELDFSGYPYNGKMGEGLLDLDALTSD
jgi:subtilisin family serine protease